MNTRKEYDTPGFEIITISSDVIKTSGGNNIKPDHGENDGEWI